MQLQRSNMEHKTACSHNRPTVLIHTSQFTNNQGSSFQKKILSSNNELHASSLSPRQQFYVPRLIRSLVDSIVFCCFFVFVFVFLGNSPIKLQDVEHIYFRSTLCKSVKRCFCQFLPTNMHESPHSATQSSLPSNRFCIQVSQSKCIFNTEIQHRNGDKMLKLNGCLTLFVYEIWTTQPKDLSLSNPLPYIHGHTIVLMQTRGMSLPWGSVSREEESGSRLSNGNPELSMLPHLGW